MNGDDLRGIHHCKFLFISFGHVIYLIFIYLHIATCTWRQRHNKIKNKNIKKIILTACFKASPMRSATSRFWWTSGGRLSHACTITNISSTPIPANIIIVPCFRKGILHHLYCVWLNCTVTTAVRFLTITHCTNFPWRYLIFSHFYHFILLHVFSP